VDGRLDGVDTVLDEHVHGVPAEGLRPYVAWYTGYRQRGVPPAVLAHLDPAQRPGEFGSLIGGLHASQALIGHPGAQSGVQVALAPGGARALFGLPAGELAQVDLPAEAVLGAAGPRISERLAAADGWRARFAVLDDAGGGAGRADRLERASPGQPVPRRDRADTEGRRPGHPV
jgi:hypothetical protein